ncbi:MAG: rod shape-determining protein MreD [Bacteroidales bacterium]|nr:rod shape-determining protein MreD [Bacteroidales bacterium]
MGPVIIANIIRFIILIPLQVLILDNINFGGYINPYLYILFILLLPFETPGWLLLISSFILGLFVDVFTGTQGIHAAASVLIAYLRPFVSRSIASGKEFEAGMLPSIRDLGLRWFITYSFLLIVIHHFSLFMIEAFKWPGLFDILQRTLFSALFTLVLVVLSEYLFSFSVKRK